ncbi:integrin alpha pat-2 [Aphelenchoides avenae]|nr:integrin alpha pat-2 [Aphelenchus avenae]
MPFISDRSKAKCQVKQLHNVNPAGLALSKEHAPPEEEEFDDHRAAEDDYEEVRPPSSSYNYNRRQRQASTPADLREHKIQLKEAVKLAQQAGTAVEYRGKLNRAAVDCHSLNCTQITCQISRMEEDDFVQIEIFSRLWANTLIDDSVYSADMSSLAFAQITSLPAPSIVQPAQVIAVTTNASPTGNTNEQYQQGPPVGLVLLAVLITLPILALITLCCWRLGVFKRNRPPQEEVQRAGPTNVERYADSSARYAPSTKYSAERHGAKV